MSNYRMVPGLMTEELDQELLVCDTDLAVVHRVSGPAADVLRQVLAGDGAPIALEDNEITSGLVAAGVLVAADAPEREVDRRAFVRAAAAVGTIGVVTLALPRAAAASSGGGSGGDSEGSDLPAEPSSAIVTSFSQSSGVLGVWWQSTPEQFDYTYSISDPAGTGTGALSGTLTSSASYNLTNIFTAAAGTTIEVTFTSLTSPQNVATQSFTAN